MADAAISATVDVVLKTVISLATDRVILVLGFKEELERLSRTAGRIQGFLADAVGKMHSSEVRDWLNQLEEEVFKADNVLDELNYENLRREVKYRDQLILKKVCFFFSFCNTVGFRSRLASKIRGINMNLERINREANEVGLVLRFQIEDALPAAASATTSRQTDSIVVPNVVKRVNDESKIVQMLLNQTEKVVSVIPITGMGGLGKTTLAKSIYNNQQIHKHFGKKIWVCVAKKIEIMELFKLILESLTTKKVEVEGREAVVQGIQRELGGERYFLVLDDVWNPEQGLWDEFFTTFEGLNATKGSWCLVTTRLVPVANAVSILLKMNDGPYYLEKLSDDECWSILKRKVRSGEEVPKELQAIKKLILKKCDGLPLAAKLIGGLLVNKGEQEWKSIVEESQSNKDQDQIEQILKVSFDHLSPAPVKKCFAYCSIFPQDTELKEDQLIEHWMAEGFVPPDHQNQRLMEEIGGDYLRILLQNSLLEKVENWRGAYYKMHDLVHDFAKSVLNPEGSSQDRYLILNSSEELEKPALIRTLFLHLESGISADIFLKLEYLHVLRLSGDDLVFLPSSIRKLLHLRLLDISSSRIKSLPESLCKLYNLQTLTISRDSLERGFPKRMSDLISLRHLNYYDSFEDFKMPTHMQRLTCLQTLRFFNVSQEKGCGIEELGTLKNLKGSLKIRNLGLVKGKEAAKQAKLFEKPNLSGLVFKWEQSEDPKSDSCAEDVLDGLQPHQNLQELKIHYFMGNKFPQWFMNLSKLVELRIKNCQRCSELPALGQLPSLKCLYLYGLENIQFVGDEFYGITHEEKEEGRSRGSGSSTIRRKFFPALEELRVEEMENLAEWKDAEQVRSTISEAEVDVFPMLNIFTIRYCPHLTTLPCLCEKILEVRNCPNLTSIRTGNSTSLESLTLTQCENLRELPEDVFGSGLKQLSIDVCPRLISLGVNGQKCPLSCLERLTIYSCDELTSIPSQMFKSCTSLQNLSVGRCPNLESFSLNLQETPSLEEFRLFSCPKLIPHSFKGFAFATRLWKLGIYPFYDVFDWSDLVSTPALRQLDLYGLPHTDSLPRQLHHLTALTSLQLWDFGGIEVLPDWIGDLVSLEKLWLLDCKKLRSLPSEAAMTPQAVNNKAEMVNKKALTALKNQLHVVSHRWRRRRRAQEEAVVSELKHLNNDVVENCFLKVLESFKKQYAAILVQLHEVNEQRNTYQGNISLAWPRLVANLGDAASILSSLDRSTSQSQDFGSHISEIIESSRRKAITMVDIALQAMSSLKGRENTFEKIEEAIDYVNEQLPSDDSSVPAAPDPNLKNATDRNEAQIPSELITQCVTTLLMIQESNFKTLAISEILMATKHLQCHHGGSSSTAAGAGRSSIDDAIGADLLHNILSRLPATSFASAACVNRSWNSICSRNLSCPKLSSAISLNPSLQGAVNEVVEKVLSEPIRPQFVIASIGPSFSLPHAHQLITARFGSRVPVITSLSDGIIGRDALTSEFKEVQWEVMEDDEDLDSHGNLLPNQGIVLTVGHLPDMRATMIPLSSQDEEPLMIDEFVMDIREYASLVSGSMSPAAIILFSDLKTDMRPVLQKLDYAFSLETVVVGEGGGRCFYRSDWDKNTTMKQDGNPAVVALLFVKDIHQSPGIGETQFHATLSTGLHPVGAAYKAASVREEKNERSMWLTARREGTHENLDGQSILHNVYNEIGDRIRHLCLYIGVNKRRKCSVGLEKARWMTFLEFHEVMGGDEEYLYVNDLGIRTGDSFRFYVSDSDAALGSSANVTEYFRRLKHDYDHMSNQQNNGSVANANKKSVFGGLIFACCGRGVSFFGRSNVDSTPFLENFPGATLGGTFCSGEIELVNKSIYEQDSEDQGYEHCSLHFFSAIYLVLSYVPA